MNKSQMILDGKYGVECIQKSQQLNRDLYCTGGWTQSPP